MEEIKIGDQIWSSRNLDVDTFRNGDPIHHTKTNAQWEEAGENGMPAWCYYDNDPANGKAYGKLYNWHAVNDPRGLAPESWHVPSDDEWTSLTDHLGGEDVAGTKMKSTSGWADSEGESGNGTNESGFTGLPGGVRSGDGPFSGVGRLGGFWSSTQFNTGSAWSRDLYNDTRGLSRYSNLKKHGFSVRCLRD